MAREIVALSPEKLEIREFEDPVPGEGEVLVRAEFGAAKHGTEMAAVKGYGRRGRFDADLQLFVEGEQSEGVREVRVGNMIVGRVEGGEWGRGARRWGHGRGTLFFSGSRGDSGSTVLEAGGRGFLEERCLYGSC